MQRVEEKEKRSVGWREGMGKKLWKIGSKASRGERRRGECGENYRMQREKEEQKDVEARLI